MTLAIDEVRKVRSSMEQAAPPTPLDPEQAARLAAIEKQKYEADLAKAEILGIDTQAAPPAGVEIPTAVVEGVIVTHTNTAVEMTTHVEVVMATVTIDLDMNRR